jgi:hypothetical protein
MITLRDKETGTLIGEISEADLQILIDAFEEEGREDRDYYIDATSPEYLEANFVGAAGVAALLKNALAGRDGMDIVWSRS